MALLLYLNLRGKLLDVIVLKSVHMELRPVLLYYYYHEQELFIVKLYSTHDYRSRPLLMLKSCGVGYYSCN